MYIGKQEMSQISHRNSHLKKLEKGKEHYKHKVSQRTKINDLENKYNLYGHEKDHEYPRCS